MKKLYIVIILLIFLLNPKIEAGNTVYFENNFNNWNVIDLKLKYKNDFIPDITYKNIGSLNLNLDIYYPFLTTKERYPVIIFVHGGSFIFGEKTDIHRFDFFLDKILDQGWAVVSINYRLVNNRYFFPENLNDVMDAIDWVMRNANRYELDSSKVGLWGSSAGGNLVLMAGMTYKKHYQSNIVRENPGRKSLQEPDIDFVISFAGPTNLLSEKFSVPKKVTGIILRKNISDEILKNSSPLYNISGDSPPILLIHGRNDLIVPYEQSRDFYKILGEKGIESSLLTLDSGHTIRPSFHMELKKRTNLVLDFIKKYF